MSALTKNVLIALAVVHALVLWFLVVYTFYGPVPQLPIALEDKASVLFGTATIVVGVLTAFVTFFGILGWAEIRKQAAESAREEVEKRIETLVGPSIERKVDALRAEFEGRLLGVIGATYGQLFQLHRKEIAIEQALEAGIAFTEKAVETIQKDSPRYWHALNNLAYFYALRGERRDKLKALEIASGLREQFWKTQDPDYATTCGRVVATFQVECSAEFIEDAKQILAHVLTCGSFGAKHTQ